MNAPEVPAPGLDREEPELRDEEDIPADDGGPQGSGETRAGRDRPLRDVERE